ncbi:MAG: hypothetical protein H6Q14_1496 [Bacteroidetes bacterium]|nr:hypothetical protein [Bacteroidota bacterium]
MEEKTTTTAPAPELNFDIALNEESINRLKSIAKWSNILVITGYVCLGAMFVFMLALGKYMDKAMYLTGQPAPANVGTIIYSIYGIVMILIYFFPLFYLQKFSKKAKQAVYQNDETLLSEALAKQDVFFKILAWYTIVSLFFILVLIIGFSLITFFVS